MTCPECGKEFEQKPTQKYCSKTCSKHVRDARHDRRRAQREDFRVKRAQRARDTRQRYRDEGRCVKCGSRPAEPGLLCCEECIGRSKG